MSERSVLLLGKLWTWGSTGLLAYCQHLPELVFNKSLRSKKISCLRWGVGSLSGGPWELLSYLVAVTCIPDISHSFIIANPLGAALHRTSIPASSYWMRAGVGWHWCSHIHGHENFSICLENIAVFQVASLSQLHGVEGSTWAFLDSSRALNLSK